MHMRGFLCLPVDFGGVLGDLESNLGFQGLCEGVSQRELRPRYMYTYHIMASPSP